MSSHPHHPLYTILLVLAALLLSLFVLSQLLLSYISAYFLAPHELSSFTSTVDFSIQENESYDANIGKISKLEDKMALSRLLREIQKSSDDLREELSGMLEEGGTKLRNSVRLLWANKRRRLEEKVRRLDMLRMRFLVVYMGLIAAKSHSQVTVAPVADVETPPAFQTPSRGIVRSKVPNALLEEMARRPPLRRLATQAMGHSNDLVGYAQKTGWAGVVAELQKSPLMQRRHASIEMHERTMDAATGSPGSPRTP